MSLTPIYDDLLREFEGIILASRGVPTDGTAENGERADAPDTGATGAAVETTSGTIDQAADTTTG
ncbi:hypothetical protein ACFFSW_34905 [Saccharothrix longispora]|uniref:Uncharacterized protein n=1 Tax=Saccharothrix longispora TaxID=33920 RepID=A0ABU1PM73_9PSEU|nr:hypothetical protein [Saccharothrix longispora]MDR6591720.1 hypothetical protein [Saccharothrix longispora]